jgi:hypothetical protein
MDQIQIQIHTFHDQSILRRVGAKELISIPIWKGNRIIDTTHANKIYHAIGGDIHKLDSSVFRVVKYFELNASGIAEEQRYIIDGQHRAWCLEKFYDESVCESDFPVIIIEKTVHDETDAIEYFNALNNVKAQHWKQDPAILANAYIAAMTTQFRTGRLIRPGATKRPYLSADKLRDKLKECGDLLRHGTEHVTRFVTATIAWNQRELLQLQVKVLTPNLKDQHILEACLDKKFVLAFDVRLEWVRE